MKRKRKRRATTAQGREGSFTTTEMIRLFNCPPTYCLASHPKSLHALLLLGHVAGSLRRRREGRKLIRRRMTKRNGEGRKGATALQPLPPSSFFHSTCISLPSTAAAHDDVCVCVYALWRAAGLTRSSIRYQPHCSNRRNITIISPSRLLKMNIPLSPLYCNLPATIKLFSHQTENIRHFLLLLQVTGT